MTKIRAYTYVLSFLFFCVASAQTVKDSTTIHLNLRYKNEPLHLNQSYVSKTDTLAISVMKFYLSSFQIQYKDGTSSTEKNSYHLVDASDSIAQHIRLSNKNNKDISYIRFNIGVDSISSVSGALSGDLDPSNGMYWAWQSGYINFKLEGTSNRCPTRKNKFQFHLGGYIAPMYAMRTVELPCNRTLKNNEISLILDVAPFFDAIDLAQTNTIMIPSEKAMQLSDWTVQLFSIE
jgi:hypothetical protein